VENIQGFVGRPAESGVASAALAVATVALAIATFAYAMAARAMVHEIQAQRVQLVRPHLVLTLWIAGAIHPMG